MSDSSLFTIGDVRRDWLSSRQALIAQNIANASTPNYKAVDVTPFSDVLSEMKFSHSRTAADGSALPKSLDKNTLWETVHSGNTVALEAEMLKEAQIHREFSLTSNLVKSFHSMWMLAAKG